MGWRIDATGIQFKLLNRSRGPRSGRRVRRRTSGVRTLGAGCADARNRTSRWLFRRAGRIRHASGATSPDLEFEDGERSPADRSWSPPGTFSERPDSHRRRAASGRAGRRAADARLSAESPALGSVSRWAGSRPARHRGFTGAASTSRASPNSAATTRSCRSRSCRRERPRNQSGVSRTLHTTPALHDLVRASIGSSPLYNGQISGHRSALLSVARRQDHAVPGIASGTRFFSSPKGLDATEVYVNGLSMSLPQRRRRTRSVAIALRPRDMRDPAGTLMRSNHDFIQPTELRKTLETKRISGSFPCGPDQWHVWLRGSRGARTDGRHQRRAAGRASGSL